MNDKYMHHRFTGSLNSLKRQLDEIPLTVHQREGLLIDMLELKKTFEDVIYSPDKKEK